MGVAPTPPGLIERIMQMVDERIARFARSGFLRNATISDGGLTVKGGFLRLLFGTFNLFYVGPITPSAPDGTPQQGFRVRRADGTIALQTRDAFPGPDGTFNQALSWHDRAGNQVFSDDTDSGQGIGRPYLAGAFYPSRSSDFLTTGATSFETLWRAKMPKQQPRLFVQAWCGAVDPAAVAEVRIMVNGVQFGATRASTPGLTNGFNFGPEAVAGSFGAELTIEIQGRLASGVGNARIGAGWVQGQQS